MKSIGIVGGAGPMAGALIFEMMIDVCQQTYGAHRDRDFPKIVLINVPFSEMLINPDVEKVSNELEQALDELEQNECELLCIACNTLHGFLKKSRPNLVDLRGMVSQTLTSDEEVVIVCTSTSRKRGVYDHLKNKRYFSRVGQHKLDQLIDWVLQGNVSQMESRTLSKLIEDEGVGPVLLGCTELSYLHARFPLSNRYLIDPLYLLACETIEKAQ